MNTQRRLRLGPLPRTETVKITFSCQLPLRDDLERYAALYAATYGEEVDVPALVPHILATFLAGDRGFKRSLRSTR